MLSRCQKPQLCAWILPWWWFHKLYSVLQLTLYLRNEGFLRCWNCFGSLVSSWCRNNSQRPQTLKYYVVKRWSFKTNRFWYCWDNSMHDCGWKIQIGHRETKENHISFKEKLFNIVTNRVRPSSLRRINQSKKKKINFCRNLLLLISLAIRAQYMRASIRSLGSWLYHLPAILSWASI